MGVLSFGAIDAEVFPLRRRFLRLLLERAAHKVTEPQDATTLRQASALDALLLELMEPERAKRVASAVAAASREFRDELSPDDHRADQELQTVLLQIEARSHRLVNGPSKFDVLGS